MGPGPRFEESEGARAPTQLPTARFQRLCYKLHRACQRASPSVGANWPYSKTRKQIKHNLNQQSSVANAHVPL